MRKRFCRQMGFTLVEVLIAFTLMGLIMVILFSGLHFAVRSWDAAEAYSEAADSRSLAQNFIRRQLMQAKPIVWGQNTVNSFIAFVGERDSLRFVAPLPAYRGQGGLYLFTLKLDEADGQGRLIVSYRLFRPDIPANSLDDQNEKDDVLADHVEDIVFEYYGPDEIDAFTQRWQATWRERQDLPALVRLHVDLAQGETDAWPDLVVPLRLVGSVAGPGLPRTGGVDFGPLPP